MGPYSEKGHRGPYHPGYKPEITFSLVMVQSCNAEKDNVWALLRPAKDWSSYDLTIYTNGSMKHSTLIIGAILFTTGHPSIYIYIL